MWQQAALMAGGQILGGLLGKSDPYKNYGSRSKREAEGQAKQLPILARAEAATYPVMEDARLGAIVSSAKKHGFNPLTVLRGGGTTTTSMTPSAPLALAPSTKQIIGSGLQAGLQTAAQNWQTDADIQEQAARIENIRQDTDRMRKLQTAPPIRPAGSEETPEVAGNRISELDPESVEPEDWRITKAHPEFGGRYLVNVLGQHYVTPKGWTPAGGLADVYGELGELVQGVGAAGVSTMTPVIWEPKTETLVRKGRQGEPFPDKEYRESTIDMQRERRKDTFFDKPWITGN